MSKRPLCYLFLVVAVVIGLCKCLGISWIWKSPKGTLPIEWAGQEQSVEVTGIVYAQEEKTYQDQIYTYVYVKQANLFIQSIKYPVRNIKCTLEGKLENYLDCELRLVGVLSLPKNSTNPGEFNQRSWEASRKIDFYLTDISAWEVTKMPKGITRFTSKIKQKGIEILLDVFPKEQAGILQAMMFADKTNLESETKNQFQAAGISHIIAISGLHMSLIGMAIWKLCRLLGLSMKIGIALSTGMLLAYGILLENPTTAFRALLMFALMMGAKLLGRSYDLLSALSTAGIVLLFDNPDLLEQSSFQLSFCAVLGMGSYCALEEEIFQGVWKQKAKWWNSVRTGISLWFFSLPVVLYSFYQVSVIGIVINLLVIPLMPVVLGSGVLALLFGFWGAGPGSIMGIPAFLLLKFYTFLGTWSESCSFGMWTPGKPQIWQMVLYYLLLFCFVYGWKWLLKGGKGNHKIWILSELTVKILLVVLISAPWNLPQKITVLDVGQGDGIVLQTDGKSILVDGGSSSRKQIGKSVLIPYFKYEGISHLDMILITHPDEDHISGVREVLEESQNGWFQVGAVAMPSWMCETQEGMAIELLATSTRAEVFYLQKGDKIAFGETKIHILHPDERELFEYSNAGSLVFLWETKMGNAFFTGDLPSEEEPGLAENLEACTFLKVGHHGSNSSTSEELLDVIKPQVALISCGRNNRYGHPGADLLKRLLEVSCKIYRTDLQGALTIDLDKGILKCKE